MRRASRNRVQGTRKIVGFESVGPEAWSVAWTAVVSKLRWRVGAIASAGMPLMH